MEKYDLCVIGGGPAGYAAAMRAIDFGKRVALVEKEQVGGGGIYDGALSSKTLWELSERVLEVNESIAQTGNSRKFEITWEEAFKTMNEAIFERKFQYSCHIKLLEEETFSKLFSFHRGVGRLLNKNEIEISKCDGRKKTIFSDFIIIATGSKPRKLPSIPVDEYSIMTSDGIHHISDFPKSLVILGAGVIGCEYATIFANFGKTKVYLIDKEPRILPFEDNDIAKIVADNLERKGVTIHRASNLVRMGIVDDKVEYEIKHTDGRLELIKVEKALISVGRIPNIKDIGLEEVGVKITKSGMIVENDTRTDVENIFAIGDVTGHIALVNVGELEARHAVERMFGGKKEKMSYDNVSTIMFLTPEVASVGLNEQQCVEKNIPVKVVKLDYSGMCPDASQQIHFQILCL